MCRVDRLAGGVGLCGQTNAVRVACAGLHFGEEPPISGKLGSGTVFFSGCTLRCSFCQNWQISHNGLGDGVSPETLADIFMALERDGAANINLVTGTPFVPGIISALHTAKSRGMALPVLWNTSGYESRETLTLLNNVVDVYLADIKTLDPDLSRSLFSAADYPGVAQRAATFMTESKGLVYRNGEDSELLKGVIIRHLVLPGHLDSTRQTLPWFRANLYPKALLALMFQYTPIAPSRSQPARRIFRQEYDLVCSWLDELGIEDGFVQEYETDKSWLPDFTRPRPFPSQLFSGVWHYSCGSV